MHVFGGHVRSGVETFILALTKRLAERQHEVILTPLATGEFIDEAGAMGFNVKPLEKRGRYDLASIPRLASMIKRYQIDILHSHAVNGAFYAVPAAWLAGLKTHVSHYHVNTAQSLADVYRSRWPRIMAHRYHLRLTRSCMKLITVNPVLKEELLNEGLPADKIQYIPNGIDCDLIRSTHENGRNMRHELNLPENAVILGTACRLAQFKNIPMMLNVVSELVKTDSRVHLVVAGDGPDRNQLQTLTQQSGMADHVHFTGWRSDVHRIIQCFDLFLITSDIEGLPMAGLEAMAMGKAIVGTRVGGMSEIVIDGRTGYLVEPCDANGMINVLKPLIHDRDQRRTLGENARQLVQQSFSIGGMVDRIESVYRQMADRK